MTCHYCGKPVDLRGFRYLQRWVGVWLTYCSNRCADCDKYGDCES